MNADLLMRACPHCAGTGHYRLTPALVGEYGMTLLRALRGWTWRATGDLPLHASGNMPTRNQALNRLQRLALVERGELGAAVSGGREYEWRLTPAGVALLQEGH